jgi:hypothetical protein
MLHFIDMCKRQEWNEPPSPWRISQPKSTLVTGGRSESFPIMADAFTSSRVGVLLVPEDTRGLVCRMHTSIVFEVLFSPSSDPRDDTLSMFRGKPSWRVAPMQQQCMHDIKWLGSGEEEEEGGRETLAISFQLYYVAKQWQAERRAIINMSADTSGNWCASDPQDHRRSVEPQEVKVQGKASVQRLSNLMHALNASLKLHLNKNLRHDVYVRSR